MGPERYVGKTHMEIVRALLDCDASMLDTEFEQLPADMGYWTSQLADRRRAAAAAKIEAERVETRLMLEERAVLAAEGGKAPGEWIVRAKVVQREEWRAAQFAMLDAEADAERVRGLVSALSAKKDMLVSLGAQARAEMDSNPSLRAQASGAATMERLGRLGSRG